MPEEITWSADGAYYIRSRSARYPGAIDIEPEWTQEVLADPDLIAFEPDPKSRMGASRFIGALRGHGAGRDRLPRPRPRSTWHQRLSGHGSRPGRIRQE